MTLKNLRTFSSWGAPLRQMLMALSVLVVGSPTTFAHYVYRMDANAEGLPPALHEFDTSTNMWSVRAALPTTNTTQIASDGKSVFALPEDGNIYRYDRAANTWDFVLAGPAAAVGRNNIAMFETYNGEFYWGRDASNQLHYTVGGVWASTTTPRALSSGSDIDSQNGRLYIRTYGELGGFEYDIATNSFPVIFDNATSVGENSRVGGYHNGYYYSRQYDGNLIRIEPNTNTPFDTGVPLTTMHASMAVSPAGLIYMNGYAETETTFEVFDINTNTVMLLASAPGYGGNAHPSLAWVPVPEPSLVVSVLVAAGLLAAVLRRR